MNKIMLKKINAGASFSAPLYLNDGENEFLPARLPITSDQLLLLQNKNITHLYTDGEEITTEQNDTNIKGGLDSVFNDIFAVAGSYSASRNSTEKSTPKTIEAISQDSLDTDLFASVKNTETYTEYLLLVKSCQRLFDSIFAREQVSSKSVSKILSKLIVLLERNPEICVALILENDIYGFELSKAAIDVTSLSYLISKYMNLTEEKINDILVASILHDVGMLRVNADVIQKTEKLNDAERQAVETHTRYSYNCIISEFMYTERIARIVMQHHEWYDGTGYPSRLKEEEIDIGARILCCADSFVAMTSKKPYRKAKLGFEAMKTLLDDNGTHFDPKVVNAMIRSIGIFPIGSIVMLSDSSLCRVVKNVPDFPLRPQLRLLIDEQGNVHNESENKMVNLQIQKNLFITQAIDPDMVVL